VASSGSSTVVALVSKSAQPTRSPVWSLTYSRSLPYLRHRGGQAREIWVGRNAIRVNGFAVPYLRNPRHEAARAAKLHTGAVGFDVVVRPALVFLTGTLIPDVTIKQRPDDVLILDRRDVPKAFRRASTKLDVSAVQAIYDHSRRSTTWSFSKLTGHVERLAAASDRC